MPNFDHHPKDIPLSDTEQWSHLCTLARHTSMRIRPIIVLCSSSMSSASMSIFNARWPHPPQMTPSDISNTPFPLQPFYPLLVLFPTSVTRSLPPRHHSSHLHQSHPVGTCSTALTTHQSQTDHNPTDKDGTLVARKTSTLQLLDSSSYLLWTLTPATNIRLQPPHCHTSHHIRRSPLQSLHPNSAPNSLTPPISIPYSTGLSC